MTNREIDELIHHYVFGIEIKHGYRKYTYALTQMMNYIPGEFSESPFEDIPILDKRPSSAEEHMDLCKNTKGLDPYNAAYFQLRCANLSPPHYSTDIRSAWMLLENFTYPLICFDQDLAKWFCYLSVNSPLSVLTGKIKRIGFSAAHESAPMSIALAALKAYGVEV